MTNDKYFEQMMAHLDAGGKISLQQRDALWRWQRKVRHPNMLCTAFSEDDNPDFAELGDDEFEYFP